MVMNISPANLTGGGAWQIMSSFGATPVTSTNLTALNGQCSGAAAGGDCNNQFDFNLLQLVTTPVPLPAALGLFAVGLLSSAAVGRRPVGARRPASRDHYLSAMVFLLSWLIILIAGQGKSAE